MHFPTAAGALCCKFAYANLSTKKERGSPLRATPHTTKRRVPIGKFAIANQLRSHYITLPFRCQRFEGGFSKKVRHCELNFYGTLYRPHIDVFREEGVFLKEIPSRVRWRVVRGLPRQRDGRNFVWIQRTADIGNKLTKIKATPSVSLRSTASRAVETALGQEMARPMCHFQVRKRSKPHRGFAKKALSHPHGRSQEGHRFPCF